MSQNPDELAHIHTATRRQLTTAQWQQCLEFCRQGGSVVEFLREAAADIPPWLAELAALEQALEQVRTSSWAGEVDELISHPLLQLIPCSWQGLPELLRDSKKRPSNGQEHVLIWPDPKTGALCCETAAHEDLLALKIVAEGLPLAAVAAQANAPVAALRQCIRLAVEKGLLLQPQSLLVRSEETHPRQQEGQAAVPEEVFVSEFFTMQWHITQRCDLCCKHCYDRSPREDVPLDQGLELLDQLTAFCEARNVQGQATFTGGNPLLHPNFLDFYKGAVQRGLQPALLGNPCAAELLDSILEVETPVYFQISLEGLQAGNDAIRGEGHYRRSLAFLELLRERGVPAQVMLTLTRANMEDVIPLARELEGKVERFTFNRLAPVGEGAALACVDKDAYQGFLNDYIETARRLPHLRFKDNLLNLALHQQGAPLFGGCTGHGCGAAFNFMAVLGDGQAHACRKMHSPMGNVHHAGLEAVYESRTATAWRRGSSACADCALRAACGGCLAVTAGLGLDPLTQRDPYCFVE